MFWREIRALADLGIACEIVSSRRPNRKLMSHSWSEEAVRRTKYLYPLSAADIVTAIRLLLRAGPAAWWRCAQAVRSADMAFDEKLKLAGLIPFAAKLANFARRRGLTHIHVGSCGHVANTAMLARLLGGPEYSLSLLGPRLDTYGPNQDQKWKHARFGLFQSRQLYEEARNRIGDSLPPKTAVAPVGVDIDVMRRDAPYEPWRGDGPCRIYCCARLNPIKGHVYLIEAVQRLRKKWNINVQLVLSGEDEAGGRGYRKRIQEIIHETGLDENVTLLGAVSEEENRAQYAIAHVYSMASVDEAAGAVATMEAMAMGVPVIMADVGATRELIEDGIDALLVPSRDPEALAAGIRKVLIDADLAKSLGKSGRAKVVQNFSHRLSAESIRKLLAQ